MAGRLIVAILLLGATLLISLRARNGFMTFTPEFLSVMIGVTFVASIVFLVWTPRSSDLRRVAIVQVGTDLLLTTALVYVTDGIGSGFTFLYGVSILTASLCIGPYASRTVTAVSLVVFSTVGLALAGGFIPHAPDQAAARYALPWGEASFLLFINITGLVVVGVLADNLASRLRVTGGELRRAVTDIANLSRMNENIVRSLTSGLLTADPHGVVQSVNPAAAEIFRVAPESLQGKHLSALLSVAHGWESIPPPGAARKRNAAPPELYTPRSEGKALRPDGSVFPVGYMKTPLFDEHGNVTGSVLVFRDLTELTELREAAEKAEKLAVLGRVSAGLAHEIRNPLGSISGAVQLVRESSRLSDEDQHLLAIVQTEVDRLNELVSTMLDIGKPKALQLAPFDLVAVTAEVARVAASGLQTSPQGRRLQLKVTGDEPVDLEADPDQLRQVIWNLLKNAMEVTPPHGMIELRVFRDHGEAVLEVRDEGPGVDPLLKDKIFELFFTGRANGVGLGLAVVKQIVEAHQGALEVHNLEPHGAMFRVRIPRPQGNT